MFDFSTKVSGLGGDESCQPIREVKKLFVLLVSSEGFDPKTVRGQPLCILLLIINKHYLLQIPPQIPHIFSQQPLLKHHMWLIQPISKYTIATLNLVNDDIATLLGLGTEHDELKVFLHGLQKTVHVGTVFEYPCLLAVKYEGLVQVNNQRVGLRRTRRQIEKWRYA